VHRSTARDASDNSPHVTAGEGASIGFLARWLSGIAPSASGRLDSAARWAAKARSAPDHPPDTLADGGRAMGFATGDSAFPPPPERRGPTHCTRRRPASIEATRPTARQARAARHGCYVAGRALGDSRNSHRRKTPPASHARPWRPHAGCLRVSRVRRDADFGSRRALQIGHGSVRTCPYEAPTGACAALESLLREFLAGGTSASQRETCTHSGADAPFIGRRAAPPGTRIRGPARGLFKVTRRSSR
jgi:hypothetical protein